MTILRKIAGTIFSLYAFAIFIALMLILLPAVIFCSFFGRVKGGNMIYDVCRFWSDAALFTWGITHKNIYESPRNIEHAVIYVFNHISYIDIPFLLKAFRKQPIRVLGKAEMASIPVFGYIYRKAAVMVARSSEAARLKSVQELKMVLLKNISVVIAPEGTFNMTHKPLKEFYNGAFRIAEETNTPIRPVIFLDAYDRLNYRSIFSLTPGRSRAVFLPEVQPFGNADQLKQKVYDDMEAALIRYKASWISLSPNIESKPEKDDDTVR